MITSAKYELMKIFVPRGIKAIVLVFIFLSLFLSEASSRETVYVFPPTYIGEEEGKLALAEEVLREEINLYFDLAHNPSYEKLVVDFMKGNSDGILNQFFYGECKEDCLLSQRILLQRLYMKSLYSLTISDSKNLTKVVLLRVSREKADSETEYCESCTDEDLKASVKSLVRQLEGPLEIAEEEPKLELLSKMEKPLDQTEIRSRVFFGGVSSSAVSSSLNGIQLFWGNLGLGYGRWRFNFSNDSYSMGLESNLVDFLYRYELPIEKSPSDLGGESYDITFGIGIVEGGTGTLKRDNVDYSSSSVSGYQLSSIFSQQRGFWEILVGLSFHGKYYYDFRSTDSENIHDRRVNWINFLLGVGAYF